MSYFCNIFLYITTYSIYTTTIGYHSRIHNLAVEYLTPLPMWVSWIFVNRENKSDSGRRNALENAVAMQSKI
jgi:hypothetical protein